MVLGSLIVARLKLPCVVSYLDLIRVDFRRCGFRLGVLFCRAVMKIGMMQNISPSFTSSHSTSTSDASPTTVRSASRKVGRLRRAEMAANWSDIATRKYCFCGGPPFICSSYVVIFQTLAMPNISLLNVRQAGIRCHNQRSPLPKLRLSRRMAWVTSGSEVSSARVGLLRSAACGIDSCTSSTRCARDDPGSNGSQKYCVSLAILPSLNSMMLTVYEGEPSYVSTNSVTQRSPLPMIRRTEKRFLFGWTVLLSWILRRPRMRSPDCG